MGKFSQCLTVHSKFDDNLDKFDEGMNKDDFGQDVYEKEHNTN